MSLIFIKEVFFFRKLMGIYIPEFILREYLHFLSSMTKFKMPEINNPGNAGVVNVKGFFKER
jgi:hypothetical protein